MKPKSKIRCTVAIVFISLSTSALLTAAQVQPLGSEHHQKHHRYKLVELETFGGPQSYTYGEDARSLSNSGIAVGQADTLIPDPSYPNNSLLIGQDAFIQHAFEWRDGRRVDLGALPGLNSSVVDWVNQSGMAVGLSTDGSIDPFVRSPAAKAVLWIGDEISNLGTLAGGYESAGFAMNDRGQIVGMSTNSTPDRNSLFGLGAQVRAILWDDETMRDIGTLGGPDAWAGFINNRGQIAGISYTSSLSVDPFLWEKGKMINLGNLGGNFSQPNWLNQRGQVVGLSNLSGNSTGHPFLWDKGVLTDLGTLGGNFGIAYQVNEIGHVVGTATNRKDKMLLAFLWKHGEMRSLGTLGDDACSIAWSINGHDQIVGSSSEGCDFHGNSPTEHAFLWEEGKMIDLNIFVPDSSELTLVVPYLINERGEIVGNGVLPNGHRRAFVLIPDGECDEDCERRIDEDQARIVANRHNAAPPPNVAKTEQESESPAGRVSRFRDQMTRPGHISDQRFARRF